MSEHRQQLLEFGFAEPVVDAAIKATNNAGLQAALDWIELHPDGGFFDDADDVKIVQKETKIDDKGKGKESEGDVEAKPVPEGFKKALKCGQCEKTFAGVEMAQLHASKTGHDDFTETVAKELSEEEKAEKLRELKEKLALKRAADAELEKERELENERLRRKTGKETEELQREREMKLYEKIRREQLKEQQEEKRAKERILAMIEEDRRERLSKMAKTDEQPAKRVAESEPLHKPTPTDSARVQIRLSDGRSFKYTLKSKCTLHDLVELVAKDLPDLVGRTFVLMPDQRILTAVDHNISLEQLGMSPSATLLLK